MIRRSTLLWLGLLFAGCQDAPEPVLPMPPVIDECEGLGPIALSAHPAIVRVREAVQLRASGGSGRYTYSVAGAASGAQVRGDRLLAGPTPGIDRVTASDDCGQSASVDVEVRAAFSVAPTRATLKPGTRFQLRVEGTLGEVTYRAETMGSGGTISATGQYTAGDRAGLDLIAVRDLGSGEQALLQYRVTPSARFRAAPAIVGLPAGASVGLATLDGSGELTWRLVSGPGSLEAAGRFRAPVEAAGIALLEARDSFTHETARLEVRVLEELTRSTRPHGRLTDVANIVSGDFDGDGFADVALGVPESDLARPSGGALFVFRGAASGLPSEPTWVLTGDSDTASFGAVLAAGDLDGDGSDDLAVSAPGADVTVADSGAVFLYKFGPTGPALLRPALTGLGRGNFGAALAIADLDGDGDRDLAIGSPGADLAPSSSINNRGVVDLFLLAPGKAIPDLGNARLGGTDLAPDGTRKATAGVRYGRGLSAADFNGDGHVDLAVLGAVNNTLLGGVAQAKAQVAVALYLGRGASPAFAEAPDLYVLPANAADGSEGTWRLFSAPASADEPARLLLTADETDSPDLAQLGGVKSGGNAGGALLFDLRRETVPAALAERPRQLGPSDAFARIWGDEGGAKAGRSAAVVDVDGDGQRELVLGAPYASFNPTPADATKNVRQAGKVLVFPYDALTAGAQLNRPMEFVAGGHRSDTLGVAVASYASLPALSASGERGLLAYAGRASTRFGDFTGRLDTYLGSGALSARTVRGVELPARLASQQHGAAVRLGVFDGKVRALVAMPGYAGSGASGDGNELNAGQALVYALGEGKTPQIVHEGAERTYSVEGRTAFGGRGTASDVALTDFDGDGRQDLVVATPQLATPTASNTEYAALDPACVTPTAQNNGGVLVFLSRADGSFALGFRVFAPSAIAGCTPADGSACKRANLGRSGIAGGFDFDGDGKQDLALTRNNGLEIVLGRSPVDASLARPSLACDPVFSLPALAQGTSSPVGLGDLDGDGCAEVSVRYSDDQRAGLVVSFGFASDGKRCKARTKASWLRISGDAETGLENMRLGVATARAGRLLGDAREFVAVSAGSYPFAGVSQPTLLLYDVAEWAALRPLAGELLVSAQNQQLSPLALVYRERAVGLGRALAGNVDFDGDGHVDLVVSAPGASINGDGVGAVFAFAGGPQLGALLVDQSGVALESLVTVVGDERERASVGQSLSVVARTASTPATLGIGAPLSYRTGTANGTTWLLAF
jgi:hypothetical protein